MLIFLWTNLHLDGKTSVVRDDRASPQWSFNWLLWFFFVRRVSAILYSCMKDHLMILKMISSNRPFLCIFSLALIESAEDPHLISLAVVEVGGNFTFQCPVLAQAGKLLSLYKQSLGQMAQTVFNLILGKLTVTEPFLDTRFTATKEDTHYLFTIRYVRKEDEATYFCLTGSTYSQSFVIGIFLAVNGKYILLSVIVSSLMSYK